MAVFPEHRKVLRETEMFGVSARRRCVADYPAMDLPALAYCLSKERCFARSDTVVFGHAE